MVVRKLTIYNKVDNDLKKEGFRVTRTDSRSFYCFVHGQMSEFRLENTLLDFIEGEYDILVTTTIIETGGGSKCQYLVFIENADHMGSVYLVST